MLHTSNKDVKKFPVCRDLGFIKIPMAFCPKLFEEALSYKPKTGDLFIVSYPKCGTTWMQSIVSCIKNKNRGKQQSLEWKEASPFLERTPIEELDGNRNLDSIKSHLPYHLIPYSDDAKYIFVARNPKDCCVSYYNHVKNRPHYEFKDGTFDNFFEAFFTANLSFGDYFDIVLSWYKRRNERNVLFLTYENLKTNTQGEILKVAAFLGHSYKEALNSDAEFFKSVLHYTSFDYMKKTEDKMITKNNEKASEITKDSNDAKYQSETKRNLTQEISPKSSRKVNLLRKGIIGDWQNYFSEEQSCRLEEKLQKKAKGTDFADLWRSMDLAFH